MKGFLILAAFLLAIPFATFEYLRSHDARIFVFHNTGPTDIVFAPPYSEDTDARRVEAGGYAWLGFFPKLQGNLRMGCSDGSGRTWISPKSGAPDSLLLSYIVLESCARATQQRDYMF